MGDAQAGMVDLEGRFAAWAQTIPHIRAACVIGSRARADTFSDLDLVTITTAPEHLLEREDWLDRLGVPWLTFVEPTTVGDGRERRVLFAGGYDVDIAVVSPAQVDRLPARGARGRPAPGRAHRAG